MHNLKANFDKFLVIAKSVFLDSLYPDGNFKRYSNQPKMSDIQVIALSCVAEALAIDSENWLFSKLNSDYGPEFPNLIHRSNFNRRRKRLASKSAELSKAICLKFTEEGSEFIIDSIPVPICKNIRIPRLKICRDDPEIMPTTTYLGISEKLTT